jgi:tetratricopeptide (TPR) repeat protein
MSRLPKKSVAMLILAVVVAGCSTLPKDRPTGLREARKPAWSLKANQREMIVSVSPVRQTVQIFSSSAAVLGAGIDLVVNAKHRDAVRQVLQGYDAGKVFQDRLTERLANAVPQGLTPVSALNSTAGFNSLKEAEDARLKVIAAKGHDALLDLKMTYGIFGYEGVLLAKIEGRLALLPENHKLWKNTLVVSSEPILASDKLADPTKQLEPNLSSPRFTVKEGAVEKWTGDGGKIVRDRFEAAVDGAVSALLCDLGLAEEAVGEYYRGKVAMNRKKFDLAEKLFKRAIELDANLVDAYNGRAVNLAHNRQVDDAIRTALALTQRAPEYGPAWYNLAWWYAVKKNDRAAARPCYEKALQLGMPKAHRIEKILSAK